jgi:CelD/BcsL family acetyltransferase involved in cellulose biosynthesis
VHCYYIGGDGRTAIGTLTLTEVEAGAENPFGPDSTGWEALVAETACPTVFLSPWWISAWHEVFGSEARHRVIHVRDGDELVGVAPLLELGESLVLAGDPDLFDYQDIVAVKGRELEVIQALLDYLVDVPNWKTFDLPSVPGDSPTLQAITTAAEGKGYRVGRTESAVAPAAELPKSWDDFLAALPKKHRHELRRKIRKLEAAGEVRQVIVSEVQGLEEQVEDFLRLMGNTNEEKAAFLTPDRRQFFHRLAAEAAKRGALKLSFLELDGSRLAACLIFDFAGVYLLYNSGYDPARSDLSVGLINKAFAVREAIETGRHRFDFLKGAERYKYSLGGQDRAIYRILVTRPQ